MQSPMPPDRIKSRRNEKLLHTLAGFEQWAIHVLDAQMNRFRGFEILVLDVEASRHHSIDHAVWRDGVLDRQGLVVLIAKKAVVLEQLLQISLSYGCSFSSAAVLLFKRHLH